MTERSCKKGYYVIEILFKLEDSVNVLGNLFRKILFSKSLGNKGTITLKIKTSSIAKTKKLSIDSIVMVSFCVMRYDCYVQTMLWRGSNIRFT